jgi:membrane protein YqaA with SNARE-associated domain
MFDWINTLQTWLQGWMSAEAGLWGLFASAFVSATLLPGSSEVVMTALVTAHPPVVWTAFAVATAGNVLGCFVSYGMGYGAHQGWNRAKGVKVDLEHPLVQRLKRFGPPALFLSFLPLVGDVLVVAAGWLRLPLATSMLWIAAGKATRYLVLALGLLGVLKVAA